jgi:Tfp pilus assembly protein PilP
MKLTTVLAVALTMTAAAWGQNPDAIDNARSVAKSLQQIKTNETNAALELSNPPTTSPDAKPAAGAPAKPATGQSTAATPAAATTPAPAAKTATAPAAKPHDAFVAKKPATKAASHKAAAKSAPATTKVAADHKSDAATTTAEAPKPPKPEEKKWAMNGKRDPFFSPVVQQSSGSGCSTGKKCLEIGQINLRGVVKAESGFIAVVTNTMNKAYFLHENDPVFNGYVVRITGDSVVFQETVQDKLGKATTHEVVKKISTPAV